MVHINKRRVRQGTVLCALVTQLLCLQNDTILPVAGYNFPNPNHKSNTASLQTLFLSSSTNDINEKESSTPPCYFRFHDKGRWMKRIELKDLKVGQALKGTKLKQDLLKGKTGPKVFFECGIGRIDAKSNWQIVNGMCRLGTPFKPKPSVIRKRVSRLNKLSQSSDLVDLYVSRILLDSKQLEVSLSPPTTDSNTSPERVSASTLKQDQELTGTVVDVRDYGVIVDVNANRNGLLHIQKVADLNGAYIDKKKGLENAGLERGARIRVAVLKNERKRLFLDFTADVKKASEEESKVTKQSTQNENQGDTITELKANVEESKSETNDLYDEAAWVEFAALPDEGNKDEKDDYYYEDDDDDYYYDEDSDIEDSLGIGSY